MQNKTLEKFFKFFANFFSKYRNIILRTLFCIVILLLAYGIWFELSHVREEIFVIRNTKTVSDRRIVAGEPVRLITLVDANEIKGNKHFVKISKKIKPLRFILRGFISSPKPRPEHSRTRSPDRTLEGGDSEYAPPEPQNVLGWFHEDSSSQSLYISAPIPHRLGHQVPKKDPEAVCAH